MDAVVVFDDVLVPWENVLLHRDVQRCNQAYARTGAAVHMTHQVVVKNIAKSEFMLGLASLLVSTDRRRGLPAHPGEAGRDLGQPRDDEGLPARGRGRCGAGRVGRDAAGLEPAGRGAQPVPAPVSAHGRDHPADRRQRPGGDADRGGCEGPAGRGHRKYYQAARADAHDRIPLFRLAWDVAVSAFGSRQVLYERFFFGDPVRMAGALVAGHNSEIQKYSEMVRDFVRQGRDEAFAAAAGA